jgi:lysophospholipase L1-like esterase
MRLVRPGRLARTARLTAAALLSTVLLSAALPAGPAFAAAGPPPGSMASMGDSITRGFNACGWFVDCTIRSYSTGSDSAVGSHYLRIGAKNPAMTGHAFNDAKTGARVADMPGQAASAVTQHVQYVTMLIGANDACTASESSMTAVSTFRQSLDTSLGRLKAGLPAAKVLVVSIPDLKRLWTAGKDNANARTAWGLFGICQSMLANPASTATADNARRDRVRQRVIDFNTQLAQACTAYGPNCAFDGNAIFNYPFALSQLSTWDYFHPNTSGQAALAQTTYQAGFNW